METTDRDVITITPSELGRKERKLVTSPFVNRATLNPIVIVYTDDQSLDGDVTVCGFAVQLIIHHVVI